jgi:[FeFe] hydrogenase H-cluster maturation GTPase HydF
MEQHRENKQHIGFFGRCNVGKSTLINTLIGQDIAIVSEVSGTTTDIVKKTMELKDVGAVVLIDTAGIDDKSELGKKRIEKTMEVFSLIDLAVIIISENNFSSYEKDLIKECKRFSIPYLIVYNKQDIFPIEDNTRKEVANYYKNLIIVSKNDISIKENLTKELAKLLQDNSFQSSSILKGLIKKDSLVVLVTPIDSSAPKGRMILPQVKVIRDVLDNDAVNIVVKETELEQTLKNLKTYKPDLVITDSQAFNMVSKIVPQEIALTSFSILLAKEKGDFDLFLKGTPYIDKLNDGDKVLMLESCTHQPTCEDIGRVKLPAWIRKHTGKDIKFEAIAGLTNMEKDISDVKMVIQCGGCMATKRQLHNRLLPFAEKGIPVSNYGLTIAYINGIFQRATKIFMK